MTAQQLSKHLENAIAVHKANVQAWSAISSQHQPFDETVRRSMERTFGNAVEIIFSKQYESDDE